MADPSDITRLIKTIRPGDPGQSEALLVLLYHELRRLAAFKMAAEAPGHTLQPTALVHEAWLRLSDSERPAWANRNHFIKAAAEAMRRILVEHARRKQSLKRGGGAARQELDEAAAVQSPPSDELLAVDEALEKLAREDADAAQLVKLRYFVGMTMEEAASVMGLKKRAAEGLWTYARVWLRREIRANR